MSNIVITGPEATFSIKTTGSSTGDSYSGLFKVSTILGPFDHINANKLQRQLLGEHSIVADDLSRQYAFMLSQLHYRIISGPLWWKSALIVDGAHIKDENVLIEILNNALEAEETYRAEQKQLFDTNIEKLKEKFPDLANAESESQDE